MKKMSTKKSACPHCELLKKENKELKTELQILRTQYTQLIKETAEENFSERRVNLLKAHILQLERQVLLLSDSMNSSSVLLADLHCYGESLELQLKSFQEQSDSAERLLKDCRQLSKLNQRIKEVPCSKEKILVPYCGRYITDGISILDLIKDAHHFDYKEISWLEGQLSTLYQNIVRLQATLQVLPQQVDTPTLNAINPLYSILSHIKGQFATCKQAISSVSQELLTLSLLVPGQMTKRTKKSYQIELNHLLKELPPFSSNKQKAHELLEHILRSHDTSKQKLQDQLQAQNDELIYCRQILDQQVQYMESLFSAIKSGYKEFITSTYIQLSAPLQKIWNEFYHLNTEVNLQSLEACLQELQDTVESVKTLDKTQEELFKTEFKI